ncbi:MAG: hypothetical protein WBW71_16405 [Bacteroidota bacterium]
MKKIDLVLLIVLAFYTWQGNAQTISQKDELQEQTKGKVSLDFEKKVNGWLAENNVPAAGIGLIENGKIK